MTIDKETLSHYGLILIICLILSVILTMATPFGEYIHSGVQSITGGFIGVNNDAVKSDNINKMEDEWGNVLGNVDPDTCQHLSFEIVKMKNPTCTSQGYSGDEYCKICHRLIRNGTTLPMKEHTVIIKNKSTETCTEDGYTGDKYCSECGRLLEKGEKFQ